MRTSHPVFALALLLSDVIVTVRITPKTKVMSDDRNVMTVCGKQRRDELRADEHHIRAGSSPRQSTTSSGSHPLVKRKRL
jgi:hypothetical protein